MEGNESCPIHQLEGAPSCTHFYLCEQRDPRQVPGDTPASASHKQMGIPCGKPQSSPHFSGLCQSPDHSVCPKTRTHHYPDRFVIRSMSVPGTSPRPHKHDPRENPDVHMLGPRLMCSPFTWLGDSMLHSPHCIQSHQIRGQPAMASTWIGRTKPHLAPWSPVWQVRGSAWCVAVKHVQPLLSYCLPPAPPPSALMLPFCSAPGAQTGQGTGWMWLLCLGLSRLQTMNQVNFFPMYLSWVFCHSNGTRIIHLSAPGPLLS